MILRYLLPVAVLPLWHVTLAGVAPEITWVEEGYNLIAKLPCHGCPFLYQDTSKGEQEPWSERSDDNALLLNISIPYTTPSISINTIPIYPHLSTLHTIHAIQVVQDISPDSLNTLIATNQLEVSHEPASGGAGAGASAVFGLSYRSTLRQITGSAALLFHFDVFALHSEILDPPLAFKMESREQKVVEVVLLQRPILSAFEYPGFEIVRAELVPRSEITSTSNAKSKEQGLVTMHYSDWDHHGRKGTLAHRISSYGQALEDFLDTGVWALFAFLGAVIALFVGVCLLCIFGADWCCPDEYERAQSGKRRGGASGNGQGGAGRLMQMQFKTPEELGLLGRGKVVGVGKSD
ncbi:hypothetical protein K491DRAFT_604169 [Lophiostoma macrostomum CBS 122681]|uniref:Uncharacterized protein n=1 Tax=Lophiostoma macrostomum CBS 122681 TaxID=1314788 RepID=A0A6A6SYE4_9PLEO|nr:hypothetical protein K491DRAFT_604169 [Lophiostoma macrostomum CBS 122681]